MTAHPSILGRSVSLFLWANRALAAGRMEAALAVATATARTWPGTVATDMHAELLANASRTAHARAVLRDRVPADPLAPLYVRLAIRDGDLAGAVALLRSHLAAFPTARQTHYQLASLLPHLGHFREANEHAGRGSLVLCGNGLWTTSSIIHFPDSPIVPAVPFSRIIHHEALASASDADAIHLVGCDSRYFCLFGKAVVNSVVRRAGRPIALHFHLVNPDGDAEALLARLRRQSALPIICSRETVSLDGLSRQQRKTYLACARYLVLPELLAAYDRPVLVTDADQVVMGDLGPLLQSFSGHDVGLLRFGGMELNILSLFSASVVLINATAGGRQFAQTLHDVLAERMSQPFGLSWHLDQAALAVTHFWHGGLRMLQLPETIMDSGADPTAMAGALRSDALFWSITMSLAHNEAKLKSTLFQQFLEPDASHPQRENQFGRLHRKPKLAVVSVSVPPSPSGQSRVLGHFLEGATKQTCLLLSQNVPPTRSDAACGSSFGVYRRLSPPPGREDFAGIAGASSQRAGRMTVPDPEHARLAAGVRQEAQEIASAVRDFGVEVLVGCTASPTNLPATALAAGATNLPFVAYLFDDPIYQWPPGPLRRFAAARETHWARRAAAVISPNEFMAEDFQARMGRRAVILRNPVADMALDHARPHPLRDPAKPLRIIYTGTLYHAQADAVVNLLQALEALAGAAVLEVHTYQSAAELAGHGIHGPHLRLMPFVDQAASYSLQRNADVLFLPLAFHSSIPEVLDRSAPAKTGEYLAAGRPLLVHAPGTSFLVKHIRDHNAGLVVDRPDPVRLVAALRQLIVGGPEVAVTVANARKLAEQYRASVQRDAFWALMCRVADGERID